MTLKSVGHFDWKLSDLTLPFLQRLTIRQYFCCPVHSFPQSLGKMLSPSHVGSQIIGKYCVNSSWLTNNVSSLTVIDDLTFSARNAYKDKRSIKRLQYFHRGGRKEMFDLKLIVNANRVVLWTVLCKLKKKSSLLWIRYHVEMAIFRKFSSSTPHSPYWCNTVRLTWKWK